MTELAVLLFLAANGQAPHAVPEMAAGSND